MTPMKPIDIKHALEKKGFSQADIARATGLSPQLVGQVIRRERENDKIQTEIAGAIGMAVADVFPAKEEASAGT